DLIATGTELSPNAEHLDLAGGQHVVSSFFDTAEQPTKNLQDQACTTRDAHEKELSTETSVQPESEAESEQSTDRPPETTYVRCTIFETDRDSNTESCPHASKQTQ